MQGVKTAHRTARKVSASPIDMIVNIGLAAAGLVLVIVIIAVISNVSGIDSEIDKVQANISELTRHKQALNNQLFNNRDEANILNMAVLDYNMHKATEDEITHVDMTEFYDVVIETVAAVENTDVHIEENIDAYTEAYITEAYIIEGNGTEEQPEETVSAPEQLPADDEITIDFEIGNPTEEQSAQIGE